MATFEASGTSKLDLPELGQAIDALARQGDESSIRGTDVGDVLRQLADGQEDIVTMSDKRAEALILLGTALGERGHFEGESGQLQAEVTQTRAERDVALGEVTALTTRTATQATEIERLHAVIATLHRWAFAALILAMLGCLLLLWIRSDGVANHEASTQAMFTQIQAQAAANNSAQRARDAQLQADLAVANGKLDSANSTLKIANSRLTAVNVKLATLISATDALKSSVATLRREVGEGKDEILERIDEIDQQVQNLDSWVSQLNAKLIEGLHISEYTEKTFPAVGPVYVFAADPEAMRIRYSPNGGQDLDHTIYYTDQASVTLNGQMLTTDGFYYLTGVTINNCSEMVVRVQLSEIKLGEAKPTKLAVNYSGDCR